VADDVDTPDGALPPPTEEIHLPDPSYLPVVLAFGVTIAIVGVVLSWVLVVIGAIIFLISLLRWIRQTRAEMAELPLGH
jgi:Flp pilus assembly protein TadB